VRAADLSVHLIKALSDIYSVEGFGAKQYILVVFSVSFHRG